MQYSLYDRYNQLGNYDRSFIDEAGRADAEAVNTVFARSWIEAKHKLGLTLTTTQTIMLMELPVIHGPKRISEHVDLGQAIQHGFKTGERV